MWLSLSSFFLLRPPPTSPLFPLHDALPIYHAYLRVWTRDFSLETMIAEFARFMTTAPLSAAQTTFSELIVQAVDATDRKSTRLNSSHVAISYAVFCLKKKRHNGFL